MDKQQYNELIELLTSKAGHTLLVVLEEIKNKIADAREGDYSVEVRKYAIAIIDEKLYNIVKSMLAKPEKRKDVSELDTMI